MTKILVVEDEDSLRTVYSRRFRNSDYDVETASGGEDALVKANTGRPDLILLDIIMPDLNGLEVLKILKRDPDLRNIPVLMLSSVFEINQIKECLDNGAIGYVMKNGSLDELIGKVNRIVQSFSFRMKL